MNVTTPEFEFAYVELQIPEPSSLDGFFGDVVGLVPGAPSTTGELTWRDDAKAQRLIVGAGEANDAVAIGFEATDDAAFDAVLARLAAAGYTAAEGSAEDCARRRVQRLARTASPWGVTVELVAGLADAAEPFDSALMPGGFLTDGLGFGHAVFITPHFDEAARFLVDGLGFAQSDFLQMEMAPGVELEVRFFHCNPRHHTLALARAPFEVPQRLHHVMFETRDRDDVGAAFDRVWASELTIANGLGRHDNDKMFSFYVVSPAGFQVEIGHGARQITDPWTDDRRYDRISQWGHQRVQRA